MASIQTRQKRGNMESIQSMVESSDISMQINLKDKLDSLEATKDNLNFGRAGKVKTHFEIDQPLSARVKKGRYGEKTKLVVGLPIH